MLIPNVEQINGKTLSVIFQDTLTRRSEREKLFERYKASKAGVPIKTREYYVGGERQYDKVNNKIANDFFSEIVDMKTGFFCGVPISYVIENDAAQDVVNDFNRYNSMPDVDYETAKAATICGLGVRMFYYIGAKIAVKVMNAWEFVFTGEAVDDPREVIRFYKTQQILASGKKLDVEHADVYDAVNVYPYVKREGETYYTLVEGGVVPHMVPGVPVRGVLNNEDGIGDAEKVLELIDGYDRALSDINSELEQFRLAYLAITGAEITEEVLQMAKRTGAFSLPGPEAKIEFIVKNLNDAIIEHHLDRMERNIYRFSRTPNMNDESFAGNLSGIAMKFKFRSFEDKCKTAELKFKRSLREQYAILTAVWSATGLASFDYLDVEFVFTRNYPQNLIEEITFLQQAKGIISDETALSLVSFIDHPKQEMEKIEVQREENIEKFLSSPLQQTIGDPADDEKPTEE
jgi:SPP1 family phage portal protein